MSRKVMGGGRVAAPSKPKLDSQSAHQSIQFERGWVSVLSRILEAVNSPLRRFEHMVQPST